MRKIITFFASIVLIVSLGSSAFADSGINNSLLENSKGSSDVLKSLHDETFDRVDPKKEVQRPQKKSYVETIRNYYVDAPKGHSILAYTEPDSKADRQPDVYHGMSVTVWAEENGWALISYLNTKFEECLGWVNAEHMSSMPRCEGVSFGGKPLYSTSQSMYMVEPEQKWSSFNFVGSKTKYVELSTNGYDADAFVAMDIYYRVISRNGISDASGERNVYINDGSGREHMGSFEVNKDLEAVRIHINYDEPREIKAFAIIPTDSELEKCLVCQHVQWLYYPGDK